MYVDFQYYTSTYEGSIIPFDQFTRYEKKARKFIDNITFNRLIGESVITEEVKECVCEIMELNYKLDIKEAETDGKIISSESVDSLSVTYAVSDVEKNEIDKSKINRLKYYNIAKEYLGNTDLLYRGL